MSRRLIAGFVCRRHPFRSRHPFRYLNGLAKRLLSAEWNVGQQVPFRVRGAQYFSTINHMPKEVIGKE